MRVGRTSLVSGGLLGLVLTPPFALSYFLAYGHGERPPPWLDALREPLDDLGLIGVDRVASYHRYGLAYGLALLLVLVGLIILTRQAPSRPERVAWAVVDFGLGVVAVGTLMDYGLPYDGPIPNVGFALELSGYLIIMIATLGVGFVLRRRRRIATFGAVAVGVVVLVGMAIGTLAVGHIPSGPGISVMVAAVVGGLRGVSLQG